MTREQHLLLITLFAKQNQSLRVIVEMLQSRGVISADDGLAFQAAVALDLERTSAIFEEAKAAYVQLARALGISGTETL